MIARGCIREPEILEAVLADRLTEELRAHAATCAVCGDFVWVATAVHDEFGNAQRRARVPAAHVVWLRAQMRAREEAERTAARPIVFTQALTIAGLIGLLLSLASRLSVQSSIWTTLAALPSQTPAWPLGIALASWLVLAPLALYLAFARD
jgi:hypothetical protein